MKYSLMLQTKMRMHPKRFPNENEFLHYAFFVNGNGMEWMDGELVDPFLDDDTGDTEWNESVSIGPEMKPVKTVKLYPVSVYSPILNMPFDTRPDWLCASKRAVEFARTLEMTIADRAGLIVAHALISNIEEAS